MVVLILKNVFYFQSCHKACFPVSFANTLKYNAGLDKSKGYFAQFKHCKGSRSKMCTQLIWNGCSGCFKMTPLMSTFHKLYLRKPDLEILQLPLVYSTNSITNPVTHSLGKELHVVIPWSAPIQPPIWGAVKKETSANSYTVRTAVKTAGRWQHPRRASRGNGLQSPKGSALPEGASGDPACVHGLPHRAADWPGLRAAPIGWGGSVLPV